MSDSFESRLKFEKLMWLGGMGMCLLIGTYFMAANLFFFGFLFGGVCWLFLLPYHSKLSIYLAVATFGSAFLLPFFPGRPFFWEFAALLAWSGLIVTVSMRRYAPDFGETIRRHRWLFVGVICYCVVLIATMFYRGVGLRLLGSEMMGGRFYFQQLTCAIFPLLFCMVDLEGKTLVKLFVLQCVLSATYIISEFAYSIAPSFLLVLLQFFELPADATNFEIRGRTFGVRRFQSLNIFSQGYFFLLLTFFGLKDFFRAKGFYLIPLAVLILGIGVFSGHRYLAMILFFTLIFASYAQRFWTPLNASLTAAAFVVGLAVLYSVSYRLPLAAQRAVSFMPGIEIKAQAREDGHGTMVTRSVLRKVGMDMVPNYLWVGRGFGMARVDYSHLWDPTGITLHVNQGRFYNGFVGLMVNTGIFGFLSMSLFLAAGSVLAWRILNYIRDYQWNDSLSRVGTVVGGLWMANVIAFLIFHGDSEYAMKTFALQAGVLIALERILRRRIAAEEQLVPAAG